MPPLSVQFPDLTIDDASKISREPHRNNQGISETTSLAGN
jgi:hypothetical protein